MRFFADLQMVRIHPSGCWPEFPLSGCMDWSGWRRLPFIIHLFSFITFKYIWVWSQHVLSVIATIMQHHDETTTHWTWKKRGAGMTEDCFRFHFFIICTEIFLCVFFFRQVERTSIAGRDRYTWSSFETLKQRKRQQGAGGQGVEFKWNGPGPCGSLEDMRAVEGRSDVLWDWLSNNRPLQRIYGESNSN